MISSEDSLEATLKTGSTSLQAARLSAKISSWSFCSLVTPSKYGHLLGHRVARWVSTQSGHVRDSHKLHHSSCSTHQGVCIHEHTFAIMSKGPAVKFGEGYTQLWPLQQSQTDWVSTVKCIHLSDFIKHAAQDRPTRANSGEKEGNLLRVTTSAMKTVMQHIYCDSNKG